MRRRGSAHRVWLREGCFVVAALAFAAATVWLGRTLPQFNDDEALQTITDANTIGHLLAAYVPTGTSAPVISAPFTDALRAYVLDPMLPLPDKVELYYWPYPSETNVIVCGVCIGSIRHGRSSKPVLGHFLKFFPLAYWVVWDRPQSATIHMQSFEPFRRLGSALEADSHIGGTLERSASARMTHRGAVTTAKP